MERERVVREKVAASTFSRGYLSGIISSVFDGLVESGHFFDPVLREVEQNFMPWLKDQAAEYLSQGVIARQVVRKLVEAAAKQVDSDRAEATEKLRLRQASAAAWAKRQEEAAKALEAAETTRQANLGNYVLNEMQPRLVPEDQVAAVKAEIEEARAAKAAAEYEELKVAAGEKAKVDAEAKTAEQAAALEEAKAAGGDDATLPEDWQPEGGAPAPIDVEAAVAAAVEAVVKPEPKEVTIDDILGALLDKAVITKDAIMQAMALDALGEEAYFRQVNAAEQK